MMRVDLILSDLNLSLVSRLRMSGKELKLVEQKLIQVAFDF